MMKMSLKCGCTDESIVTGSKQSFLYTFTLDKATSYKISQNLALNFKEKEAF